jgi:hypothetical protein
MVRGDTSHGGALKVEIFHAKKTKNTKCTTEEFEYQSLFLCLRCERCVKLFF